MKVWRRFIRDGKWVEDWVEVSGCLGRTLEMIDQRLEEMKGQGPDLFEQEEVRKAREQRDAGIKALRDSSGIPERFSTATLAGWKPEGPKETHVRDRMLVWVEMLGKLGCPSMSLQGSAGTGKTWIACGILNDRHQAMLDGMYTTAKDYTGRIKESYRKDSPEPESVIRDRYASVGVLVIDELGRQFETEVERLYLFDLMNERYNRRKPTLLVTNMDIDGFRAFLGDAITDRLREGGGAILELNWASRRA
jgi:DNA replication protein DnaC